MSECTICRGGDQERAIAAAYRDQMNRWRAQGAETVAPDDRVVAGCIGCGLTERDRAAVENVYGQVNYAAALDARRATADPRAGYPTPQIQTRTTIYRDGCLVIRAEDPDEDTYVLCYLRDCPVDRTVTLVGWTTGRDAKRYGDGSNVGPDGSAIWFVPPSALRPMGELQALVFAARARLN